MGGGRSHLRDGFLGRLSQPRIIDIAADNGFADVSHFHRVFRQTYGYPPARCRPT